MENDYDAMAYIFLTQMMPSKFDEQNEQANRDEENKLYSNN